MMQFPRVLLVALSCLATLDAGFSQSAVVLISDEEAKLPPPKTTPLDMRGVTRAPKIALITPEGEFRSPTALKLAFQSHGGVAVDVNSLRVLYLRTPDVDLTMRIKPFVSAEGIDLRAAIIPAGEHTLRFDIKDVDGRQTSKIVVLKAGM